MLNIFFLWLRLCLFKLIDYNKEAWSGGEA